MEVSSPVVSGRRSQPNGPSSRLVIAAHKRDRVPSRRFRRYGTSSSSTNARDWSETFTVPNGTTPWNEAQRRLIEDPCPHVRLLTNVFVCHWARSSVRS
jgi:hypothetical protein